MYSLHQLKKLRRLARSLAQGGRAVRPAGPLAHPTPGRRGPASLALAWLCLLSVGALWGADNDRGGVDPNRQPSNVGATAPMEYVLCPRDVIMVRVFEEPELETKAVISQDGTITMPLLGAIKIGSQSVARATQLIRDLLAKDYIVDPQVNLAVLESKQRQFTVMGQVQRPGVYAMPLDKPMYLLDAIAAAGGFTTRAKESDVKVQRKVDGETRIYKLDAGEMGTKASAKPFEIHLDDMILVGEKVL